MGRFRPEVRPLTLVHTLTEKVPFRITSIGKWYQFHLPSLELSFVSLVTAVDVVSLKYDQMKKGKTTFFDFCTAIKCIS